MSKLSKSKIILLSGIIVVVSLGVIITISCLYDSEYSFMSGICQHVLPESTKIIDITESPCRTGYTLIGDICEPTPPGYVETRNRCEIAVGSREAAGVDQNYILELEKCKIIFTLQNLVNFTKMFN